MNQSRRTFLQTTLATALASGGLHAQAAPVGRKLRIAGIGVGGMGFNNMTNLAGEDIVALCDVDHVFAARAFNKFPAAKRWKDFREMLEKQPEIEAVMIGTPDHHRFDRPRRSQGRQACLLPETTHPRHP